MKRLLLILLCLPFIGVGQSITIIPDPNFEQRLISFGYDNGPVNGYVYTNDINAIDMLDVSSCNISDLTGIEGFSGLEYLYCYDNQLTSLDVSSNTILLYLSCEQNQFTTLDLSQNYYLYSLQCRYGQLTSLDLRNGNNTNMSSPDVFGNPNLTCINVDDSTWSTTNWTTNISPPLYFSNNCSPPSTIQEHSINKELLKVTDLLGRKTNQPLFYIYDDGTVEKRIIIE